MPSRKSRLGILLTLTVMLCGLILSYPTRMLSSEQRMDRDFPYFDSSWQLDTINRLHFGQLAGRDFIFTCGPVYQIMHALGAILPGRDIASEIRYFYLIENALVVLSFWGLLTLFGVRSWPRALLFLAWFGLWSSPIFPMITMRNAGALFAVTYGASLLALPKTESRSSWWGRRLYWAATGPVMLLYTFDCGVFVTGATLLATLVLFLAGVKLKSAAAASFRANLRDYFLATIGGNFALVVLLYILPGWKTFLRFSLETAKGYDAAMSWPIEFSNLLEVLLFLFLALGTAGLAARHLRHRLRENETLLPMDFALLGAACFAALALRGTLTRSDSSHLTTNSFPASVLLFLLVPLFLASRGKKWALILLPGVVWQLSTPLVPGTIATLQSIPDKFGTALRDGWGCPTLVIAHPAALALAAALDHIPDQDLYVWRNMSLLNAMSGKRSPDFTVQTYAAHLPALEDVTIANLEATPGIPVLIPGHDPTLDQVIGETRTPKIFHYLLDHYELTEDLGHDNLLLRPRRAAEAISWRPSVMVVPKMIIPTNANDFTTADISPRTDARQTDIFSMTIKSAKTSTFPVGKPGYFYVTFQFDDGTDATQRLLIFQDGQEHQALVTPNQLTADGFRQAFAHKPVRKAGHHVDRIGFFWRPMDVLTAEPKDIEISNITVLEPQPATASKP